jgi:predicted O-methyltransferase YrrM
MAGDARVNFSNDWFDQSAKTTWDILIPLIKPKKILEVGSYEGRSICYLIEKLGNEQDLEIFAIDTWEGGSDKLSKNLLGANPMNQIYEKFLENTRAAISKVSKKIELKISIKRSDEELGRFLSAGFREQLDFVYIDGSHETTDVLLDCCFGFQLLKPGGYMAMDDYLWAVGEGSQYRPKLAIDAFLNTNFYKLDIIMTPNSQVWIRKK